MFRADPIFHSRQSLNSPNFSIKSSSGVSEQMKGVHQTMFESMDTATWQERRNLMNQLFQARQQSADTVHEAAAKLLAALDPTQKAKAQSILPGLAYRRGMMGYR